MLSYIVHLTFLESAVPLCALSLLKLFHYQLYVSAKTLSDTTDVLLRAYAGSILSINIIIIINTFFYFLFLCANQQIPKTTHFIKQVND